MGWFREVYLIMLFNQNISAMLFYQRITFTGLRLSFVSFLSVAFFILSANVKAAKSNLVYINLGCSNSMTEDVSAVYFDEGPTTSFDSEYDAYKLMPGAMYVCTMSDDDRELSINGMPEVVYSTKVPVKVVSPHLGEHFFRFENVGSMDANLNIFLVDYLLGEMVTVTEGFIHYFDLSSQFEGRFEIVVSAGYTSDVITNLVDVSEVGSSVSLSPVPCESVFTIQLVNSSYLGCKMIIYDQEGRELMAEVLNGVRTEITLPQSIRQGQYIVVISKDGKIESNKLIVVSGHGQY